MIRSLTIENFALINRITIEFKKGLTIITGETGAGKSIIIDALSLLLGQRADKQVLRDTNRKCIVEATVIATEYALKSLFDEIDVDYQDEVILRREIQPTGKSRAFINDTPVDLNTLKTVAMMLIDIHSQHESLSLADHRFQMKMLDTFAASKQLADDYAAVYQEYVHLQKQYKMTVDEQGRALADFDYTSFQFKQLNDATLVPHEQEELEMELNEIENISEIKEHLSHATQLLSGDEQSLLLILKEICSHTGKLSGIFSKADEYSQRLDGCYIELKDIAAGMESLVEHVEFDPQRYEWVKQRLDLIYSLEQKHHVKTVKELIDIHGRLKEKLDLIGNAEYKTGELQQLLEKKKEQLTALAAKLTKQRTAAIPRMEQQVAALLKQMSIANGMFKVDRTDTPDFTPFGMDNISFLFSANKNEKIQDIGKVASGGELSRLMLSIKYLVSAKMALPVIIFDEIDTGISGETADRMGNILREMAGSMQVINITHSPQIAGKGHQHLLVYKKDDEHKTNTYVRWLTGEERILETARMLSGEELTEAAIANARELLHSVIH